VPESIRNAIVLALIAVLVAVMGVGLLAWTRRPTAPPPRPSQRLPLLVNDREGGVYDLNLKLRQMERRVAETQVSSQQLMEQLKAAAEDRARLTNRITGLEKEVRNLRKRVQETEQRPEPRSQPIRPPVTTTPAPPAAPPSTTSTPSGEAPAGQTP
jgi:hypothetical protein